MKAAIVHQFKEPLTIEEIATPQPAPDEVLIKVAACGVCHSDLHLAEGDWPQMLKIIKKPLILGLPCARVRFAVACARRAPPTPARERLKLTNLNVHGQGQG